MNANTNMRAQGLRVLVTAGASGIGYAIAKTFSNAGARVHLCDIDEAALAKTKAAMEVGPDKIRVNCLQPGLVEGDRLDQVVAATANALGVTPAAYREHRLGRVSLRTTVSAQDVANVALFLATDAGKHISGQAIPICGNVETLA